MKRRSFLAGSLGAAGVAAGFTPKQAANIVSKEGSTSLGRPNILFIMTDQQRYDCVGANGNTLIHTPHIDALAAESSNFTNMFVQAPVCVPSRACIFTGRYAHAHRNRVNYTVLDEGEVLMQARLQEAGYRTALVGKTHLYHEFPFTNAAAARTGFDLVDLHDGAGNTDQWSDYVTWRNEHDPLHDVCGYRDLAADVPQLASTFRPTANPFRQAIDVEYTDTAWVGLRTRERLEELASGSRPFFLFSSFWKPHSPFEVPAPYDSMYSSTDIPLPRPTSLEEIQTLPLPLQRLILRDKNPPYDMDRDELEWVYRSYYGTITHIDDEVGRILATLDELGLRDNTVVVFCSDHGDQLLEHGLMGKNVFFEGSIHVPFMIRMPDRVRPGNHDALVETIDVLPTLFELIDLETPYHGHGHSLVPLINGGSGYVPRDAVFCENIIPEVISSQFFFEKGLGVYRPNLPGDATRHADAKMVRTKRWKYNYYPEGYAELYDILADPGEQNNLAGDPEHQDIEQELKERLLNWLITSTETEQIAPKWLV